VTRTASTRLLVPLADSVTVRETVSYAVERAVAAHEDGPVALHFVVVARTRAVDPDAQAELGEATDLLDRVEAWVAEDFGDERPSDIGVELDVVGADRYLFSPGDYADVLAEYVQDNEITRVVLDPEFDPGGTAPMLRPLENELLRRIDVDLEEAPVERPTQPTVLARAIPLSKYAALFVVAYGFYLLLSPGKLLDLVTGAITAGIVAALLAPVTFSARPSLSRVPRQVGRFLLYVPYLLWQIVLANIEVAYVVLHPSLPIDPKVVCLRAAVWGDLPVTTLANSITLTPGTLTVSVSRREFDVHSLTVGSREDLFEGGLERAVRFVFYGREAAAIASPNERGDGADEVSDDG